MENWQDQIKDMANKDSDAFKSVVTEMKESALQKQLEQIKQANVDFQKLCEERRNAHMRNDNVNHPQHYKLDGLDIEVIDLIRSATGTQYAGYLLGNLIKYVMRYKKKNGVEDLKKAKVYLDWLIEANEHE